MVTESVAITVEDRADPTGITVALNGDPEVLTLDGVPIQQGFVAANPGPHTLVAKVAGGGVEEALTVACHETLAISLRRAPDEPPAPAPAPQVLAGKKVRLLYMRGDFERVKRFGARLRRVGAAVEYMEMTHSHSSDFGRVIPFGQENESVARTVLGLSRMNTMEVRKTGAAAPDVDVAVWFRPQI
jgi:hypothetical protein